MRQFLYEVQDDVEKTTEELLNELQKAEDFFEFVRENETELESISLTEQLELLLEKYQKPKKDVIRDAGLDTTYGYQIFDGRHKPGRDKLLCLAFGIGLTVDEVQLLLKTAQMQPLYPRVERDVIILESLFNNKTIFECNIKLNAKGFEILR